VYNVVAVRWLGGLVGGLMLVALAAPRVAADPVSPDGGAAADAVEPPAVLAPESPALVPGELTMRRKIVGFRVRGNSKLTERTLAWLLHVEVGDLVGPEELPHLEQALVTAELFKSVAISYVLEGDGVIVVATLDDKLSWLVAPTLYLLPNNRAFGFGFAENNLFGEDKKILLYGQVGTTNSFFFGTYLDPQVRGTKFSLRFDLYLKRQVGYEYLNPASDGGSKAISRISTQTYLDGGILAGYAPVWWLVTDLRLRTAWVQFRDSHADDAAQTPLPVPERDGWDTTWEIRVTADRRKHRLGLTWGPFANLFLEASQPGLSSYAYADALLKGSYAVRLFGDLEHELEVKGAAEVGWHLPFQQEFTLGGVGDLRGYSTDQFRGDVRAIARAEYSVPLTKFSLSSLGLFSLRALGFWDTGVAAFRYTEGNTMRNYLPGTEGNSWARNAVGGGVRIYINSVVLPLLGFDVGYGLEAHSPAFFFEVGLTDL
jgi:outer membrane protein assembly factor BamA